LLERGTPEAVLLDLMMPEILGSDLVGYVREVHGIRGPVLLFSNIAEGQLQAYVRSSGADGFILKDPALQQLAEKLPGLLPLPALD
jgi:DNA-binding response OmpR family regulator